MSESRNVREKTALSTSTKTSDSIPNISSATTNTSNEKNRFGGKSYNMFFIRHHAQPKHLRLFTGNNNMELMNLKENSYNLPDDVKNKIKSDSLAAFNIQPPPKPKETIGDSKYALNMDDNLIKKYEDRFVAKRRKERILPPIKMHTCTFTLADDTLKWREELNSLGKMIGILTEEEIETENEKSKTEAQKQAEKKMEAKIDEISKLDKDLMQSNSYMNFHLQNSQSAIVPKTSEKSRKSTGYSEDSRNSKTGRFNEAKSNTAYSRKASRRLRTRGKFILCSEEAEREMWLLQILCQILKTESMQEIQSWLCSSNFSEKSAMKELIQKSLDGLNQAGRIENDTEKETEIDFDQISSSINSFMTNQLRKFQKSFSNRSQSYMDKQRDIQFSILSQIGTSNGNNQVINQHTNSTDDFNQDNVVSKIKFFVESHPKNDEKKEKENNNFNSVSLISMDSHRSNKTRKSYEKSHEKKIRNFSAFDNFLSKSTYFQPKNKAINDFLIPYSRPFTSAQSDDVKTKISSEELQDQALSLTLHPINKTSLNRFQRVKEIEPPSSKGSESLEKTITKITNMEYLNNKLLNNSNQFNVYPK